MDDVLISDMHQYIFKTAAKQIQRHKFTWNCNKCAAVMFRQKVKMFLTLTAMVSNADKELRHGSYILNPYPANMENMVSS